MTRGLICVENSCPGETQTFHRFEPLYTLFWQKILFSSALLWNNARVKMFSSISTKVLDLSD